MRFAGLSVVLSCAVAFAQPKNKSTELFEQGRALASQGKYNEACQKFDESFQLDRAPGTALNYGDCLEKMGQLRRAWQMYDSAAKDFDRDKDSRANYARTRADTVGVKLAAITVKVANPSEPGLVIQIGDQVVAAQAQIEDRFVPGEIVVTATAPGKPAFTTRANGLAGSSVIVEIPATLGGGAVGPFIDETPSAGKRDKNRVRIAMITGGVGVAAFATSVILGLSAKAAYDDGLEFCPEVDGTPQCDTLEHKQVLDDAGSRANIATGFAVAGGALIAAGAVLYFTAPRESMQVTPTATASSVGLSFSGSF